MRYGSLTKLHYRLIGRPQKLTEVDKQALLSSLLIEGWRYQDELVWWLWNERGVLVDRSTVSHTLKQKNWTRKTLQRISRGRSEELRQSYYEEMARFIADDIVFLDESIFNEKTGWRFQAYTPIG